MKRILSLPTIIVVAMCVITLRSMWQPGLPFGHDTFAHATYSKLFIHALSEGQFPVRWIEHVWIGYGQPLFNSYQVGFFYFVSAINTVSPTFLLSIKIAIVLLWWIGTLFTYLFTKKYGPFPALLAALVYIFSPYLILDIFIRTSFPEFMALSLIPAALWSIDRLTNKPSATTLAILSLITATIIVSHLPSFVIFSPVLGGYAVTRLIKNSHYRKILIYGILSVALGCGIAAFYVIPALTELQYIQINKIQSGYFDFNRHFIHPDQLPGYLWGYEGPWWGTTLPFMFTIGIIQWCIIAVSIIVCIMPLKRSKHRTQLIFWTCVILYAFFIMNRVSAWVWEAIPIFSFFQFPWRFFMLIPIATATLSAILLHNLNSVAHQKIIIVATLLLQIVFIVPYIRAEKFEPLASFNLPYDQWAQQADTREVAFFEPAYSPANTTTIPSKDQFTSVWQLNSSGNSLTTQLQHAHELILTVQTPTSTTLTINKPYMPHWQAYMDQQPTPISISDPYNFMNITVPPGEHTVKIMFAATPSIHFGNTISLISLLILVLLFFIPRFRKNPSVTSRIW